MSFVLPQSKHQANRPILHMGASYRQNLVASAPQSTHPTVSIFPARDTKPLLAVGCLSGIQREEKEDAEYRQRDSHGIPFPCRSLPCSGCHHPEPIGTRQKGSRSRRSRAAPQRSHCLTLRPRCTRGLSFSSSQVYALGGGKHNAMSWQWGRL